MRAIAMRLDAAGLPWTRFPAVAPASLDLALKHPLYHSARTRALFGRDLNIGEMGCFLSHMGAMEAALAEGVQIALILEDDAVPRTGAAGAVQNLSDWLKDSSNIAVDWVHLSRATTKWSRPLATLNEVSVRLAFRPPLIASANLWTAQGMRDFLDYVRKYGIDRPVDDALRACFCRSGRAAVLENPVFDEDGSPSTIDPDYLRHSSFRKITRMRRKIPDYFWAGLNLLRSR